MNVPANSQLPVDYATSSHEFALLGGAALGFCKEKVTLVRAVAAVFMIQLVFRIAFTMQKLNY